MRMKPYPPSKPYKPKAPTKRIDVRKSIDVSSLFSSNPSLEELIKQLQVEVINHGRTISNTTLSVEVEDGFGGSEYYGDPVIAKIDYYVEEDNPHYDRQVAYHAQQLKEYEKEKVAYKAEKAKYDLLIKKWEEEEEVRILKEKKKLLAQLKEELGDD